jgi:CRISPR-associated protein Cas1
MIVYVTTQGARVVREGRHLLVKYKEDIYHTLFIHKLEQLIICGNITVTPPALSLLLREGIDTVFLRKDGRYRGRLAIQEPKNVFLRQRQFALAGDEIFCLKTARSIVRGKLLNMVTLLQRIKRTRKTQSIDGPCKGIRTMLEKLDTVQSLDQLRGVEGQASALYFNGMRYGLDDDFGFRKRVRRPPTDPVNSVLSLLYTFLINRMVAAVRMAGLDPYPGVLHCLEYGRQSLPLDLVEEFRAPFADAVALALFNLRVLKEQDFYVYEPPELPLPMPQKDNLDAVAQDVLGAMSSTESEADDFFDLPDQQMEPTVDETEGRQGKGAVRLQPPAFKKVIIAFEKKLNTEFFHPVASTRMSYGDAMVFQARQYRRLIEGEAAQYHCFLLR